MCRWMAWSGQPVLVEELLFKSQHGLIDQSLHSKLGVETTNGDGFGLGWYGAGEGPGVYRNVAPALTWCRSVVKASISAMRCLSRYPILDGSSARSSSA